VVGKTSEPVCLRQQHQAQEDYCHPESLPPGGRITDFDPDNVHSDADKEVEAKRNRICREHWDGNQDENVGKICTDKATQCTEFKIAYDELCILKLKISAGLRTPNGERRTRNRNTNGERRQRRRKLFQRRTPNRNGDAESESVLGTRRSPIGIRNPCINGNLYITEKLEGVFCARSALLRAAALKGTTLKGPETEAGALEDCLENPKNGDPYGFKGKNSSPPYLAKFHPHRRQVGQENDRKRYPGGRSEPHGAWDDTGHGGGASRGRACHVRESRGPNVRNPKKTAKTARAKWKI
jgi:hypothetical protein